MSIIAVFMLLCCLALLGTLAKVILPDSRYNVNTRKSRKDRHGRCSKQVEYRWPFAIDLLVKASQAETHGNLLVYFDSLFNAAEADTMEHYLLGQHGIDTRDPGCIQALLTSQFHDYSLGDRKRAFEPLLGSAVFTQDGAEWKASRDLLRPQFMQTRKSFPYLQQEVETFLTKLQKRAEMEYLIDLQPLFFDLTFDTTLSVLCGTSTTLSPAEKSEFADAFDYAQSRLLLRSRLGPLYWLANTPKFWRSCGTVRGFADRVVQEAIEKQASQSRVQASDRYVFLQGLITRNSDPIMLRDQLVNIMLAGRDTTACLLSWIFKFLARYQNIQEELRHAARNLESFHRGELATVDEIKSIKILEYALNESLRLYPSVPINIREAVKETTLPSGGGPDRTGPITVRKGQAVGYSLYSMHRLKHIWGHDAEDFRPSRWAEASIKDCRRAYAPFNAGPRICPGQEFALLEAGYTVIRMLQLFKRIDEWEEEPESFDHLITLVVAPKNGCKVRLRLDKAVGQPMEAR